MSRTVKPRFFGEYYSPRTRRRLEKIRLKLINRTPQAAFVDVSVKSGFDHKIKSGKKARKPLIYTNYHMQVIRDKTEKY